MKGCHYVILSHANKFHILFCGKYPNSLGYAIGVNYEKNSIINYDSRVVHNYGSRLPKEQPYGKQ